LAVADDPEDAAERGGATRAMASEIVGPAAAARWRFVLEVGGCALELAHPEVCRYVKNGTSR
jgi:hypothetical protein